MRKTRARVRNVWDALANTPAEAENLRLRSQLMMALEQYIGRAKITQEEAATRLGVSRPRVSDLVRGHIDKFTIDKLVNMAARVGLTTKLTIKRERKRHAA